MRRAVFLDRDGVINRKAAEGDYIKSWSEFEILPGVVSAIKILNEESFLVIVISNQRCVARGIITEDELNEIHEKMKEELAKKGAIIDDIYYCPHDIKDRCDCRKPQPGLLLRAAKKYNIDLDQSWMVGDSVSDVEAGKRSGCRTVLVGRYEFGSCEEFKPDITADSLAGAVDQILDKSQGSEPGVES